MDLPPLPGDPSLAGIGEGQAGPVAPFPRGPGPGGAPQGEEVVVARRRGLEAGDVGTVVLVYPKGGYMVEFVDHEGNTLALLDLAEEEVEPLRGPALLRAKTA
jgi:hypothetical protein